MVEQATSGGQQLAVWIRSMLDPKGFNQLRKQYKSVVGESQKLDSAAQRIEKSMGGSFKQIRSDLGKANAELKRFRFEWLGVMFAGMAIQRAFQGILRASFKTWSAVTEGTQMAGGAMTQLQAAWEFFKFSLFDALLSSDLFRTFVDFALRLVEKWSNLTDSQKESRAELMVWGLLLGSALFVVGQFALGLASISLLLFGHSQLWTGIRQTISRIATVTIPALTASLIGAFTGVKTFGAAMLIPFRLLGLLFLNFVAIFTKFIPLMAATFAAAWGAALAAIGIVLVLLMKKFGSFGAAMRAWASAIVLAIVGVVQLSLNSILGLIQASVQALKMLLIVAQKAAQAAGLDKVADRLSSAINAINKFQDFKIDIMGPTAEFLDKHGFNPQPVDEGVKDTTPQKMELTNADELAKMIAQETETFNSTLSQPRNSFNDEISRLGMGYFQ